MLHKKLGASLSEQEAFLYHQYKVHTTQIVLNMFQNDQNNFPSSE